MAKEKVQKIDKVKVKMGRLIRVVNTKKLKFSNAKNEYFALQVENSDGMGERCLLLTENELNRLEDRASKNKEDLTFKDWVTDLMD
jgi:hypothetical protein